MQKCIQASIPTDLGGYLKESIREWQGKGFKDVVCKLAWCSAVYNIWRHRNDVKYGHKANAKEKMLQKVCWEVRTRIIGEG